MKGLSLPGISFQRHRLLRHLILSYNTLCCYREDNYKLLQGYIKRSVLYIHSYEYKYLLQLLVNFIAEESKPCVLLVFGRRWLLVLLSPYPTSVTLERGSRRHRYPNYITLPSSVSFLVDGSFSTVSEVSLDFPRRGTCIFLVQHHHRTCYVIELSSESLEPVLLLIDARITQCLEVTAS